MNETTDSLFDPALDSQQAIRIARRELQQAINEEMKRLQDISSDVKLIKKMKEAEKEQRETREGILKRVCMMFVSLMGWDKK